MPEFSARLLATLFVSATLSAAGCSSKDATKPDDREAGNPGVEPDEATAVPAIIRVTGIPDENPTELQRKYEPMVKFLERELGTNVEYVPVTDYGAAVQALSAGKVDFAWLGGFTHVQARVLAGAVPLCQRDIDREFKSVFITSDDAIKSLADLRGKTFAFGSKSSTSGHLMPRHYLMTEYKIDPERDFKGRPVFSDAHDATVKIVESGRVQAGALNQEVWERMVRESKVDVSKVRVIWTTPGYIDYVWTARKGLSEAVRSKFRDAFLGLDPADPEEAAVLQLQSARKFVPAVSTDFDVIEKVARAVGLIQS